MHSVRHISNLHGGVVKGLYRGLVPALMLSVPANMVYYTLYDRVRDKMLKEHWNRIIPGVDIIPFTAGAISRLILVTIGAPLEFARVYQQSHAGASMLSAFKTGGGSIKNAFRGLTPTVLRDAPYAGIYWSCIEYLRKSPIWNVLPIWKEDSQVKKTGINFASAAVGSGLACIITNPIDVIKTRIQSSEHPQRMRDVINEMKASKLGLWRNLSAGAFSRVLRAAPSGAILYSVFDLCKNLIGGYMYPEENLQ
jgi:solute carrier family 25 protein 39/40